MVFEGTVFLKGGNSVKAAFESCNLEDLVRYQNSATVEDGWPGYDIGNTL